MKVLIDKKKLLSDLQGVKEVLSAQGDPFLANIMERAIKCVERQPVIATAGEGADHEQSGQRPC